MRLTIRKRPAGLRISLAAFLALAAALVVTTSLALPNSAAAQAGDEDADYYVTAGDRNPCGPGGASPPANPVPVINSGHFAVFDMTWDDTDEATSGKTLNANLCPPAVSVSSVTDRRTKKVTNTYTRTASNIDIRETLFHIPTSNKVTLPAALPPPTRAAGDDGAPYSTTFSADRYSFLGDSGDELWIISKDDEDHLNPGFSTALLPDDFLRTGQVEFEFEAVRVPGETVGNRGTVFAFENSDGDSTTSEVRWQSNVPEGNLIKVGVGNIGTPRYHHLNWAFTEPGIYHLQVHARARPSVAHCPVGCARGVTSEVRLYKFQVGELADLDVTVSPGNATPTTGSNVVLTYTASNSGPDTAGAVQVSAPLPDGLTYVSAATATGSYASSTGEWTVGSLASGISATLAITATVGSGTAGDTLTPTAYIRDTGANKDLDFLTENNHATATLRPGAPTNSNPQFWVIRSVAENVDNGATVGAPVAAVDPDADSLSYTLSGQHADRFTVDNQGQISVTECGVMDYEGHAVYPLTLSVRDSKNKAGNADTATDASIGVTVQVEDTVDEAADASYPAVVLHPDRTTLTAGDTVTMTTVASRLPGCSLNLYYWWRYSTDGSAWHEVTAFNYKDTATFTESDAAVRWYRVDILDARDSDGNSIAGFRSAESLIHKITWEAASQ